MNSLPQNGWGARLVDPALALSTAVGIGAGPAAMGAPSSWHGTFGLGVILGGLLLVRRRRPVLVLALSAAALLGYQSAGLFEGGAVWPLSVALFTAALGRPGRAAAVGAFALACGLALQGLDDTSEALARGGVELLWLALVCAAANSWRQYGRWRAEHQARLLQLEQTRLVEQRLIISREVHDVVAHTLAVVGVHLNVAVEALDDSPEEAHAALRTAISVRNQAMTDLKAFVGGLRDVPQHGLESVAGLVEQAEAAGLEVRYDAEGDPDGVPAAQALTAYRVVQEAVVNTLRHSDAGRLAIRVRARPRALEVTVVDDGRSAAGFTAGHGLTGMRERVTALGGTLRVDADRGFTVRAVLPLTDDVTGLAP
ncbi:sensor histidine kinase [Streptomyces narbonensis]|uniref:sensor histidine kinase n=1 Tax=Streptomyces narbonensis TaxID=67333 RepID=UPI001675675F|nr:histidine kinase [Streptomyces narbonensis]GGW01624.1 two-component sensor histidine kinase [Streptomyces narbonensis]